MLPSNGIYSAALGGQATPQLTVEVLDATGSNKNMCCISVGICTAHNIWGVLKHFRNHKCGRFFNHWISFDFGSATDTWIPCMTCLASPEFFPPWGRCRSNGLPWRTSHGGCGTSPQHVFGIERNLGNAKSEWIPNLVTIFLDWKLRPASEKKRIFWKGGPLLLSFMCRRYLDLLNTQDLHDLVWKGKRFL